MNKIVTTDNNYIDIQDSPQVLEDLSHIADCHLDQLLDKNENDVWLFPRREDRYDDKIEQECILSLEGRSTLKTGNIMGFISYGDTELTIRSRFSSTAGNDWFMQYMLQKVFAINIFNLDHSRSDDSALDITALLFPYFLQKALCQGLYREYIRCEYNDSRVRGAIDFNAHIKNNYPFKNGKISYTTREYKYDNSVTQLIRHTIEFLKSKESTRGILYSESVTQDYIKQIIGATSTYHKGDLKKVMLANMKPKIHPYYSEYRPLQKLCLQILNHQKISYGESSNRIHGVLFDGAWLWEEYLNLTLSKAGFIHPKNKTSEGAIYPFKGLRRYKRFPDFMKENVIADAKYKRMIKSSRGQFTVSDEIQNDDLSQMISYLHITSSNKGIFICPAELAVINPDDGSFYPENTHVLRTDEYHLYRVGELDGYGGEILILYLNIPRASDSYQGFVKSMERTEVILLEKVKLMFDDFEANT